jgi:tRNA pseudouridine38-40 synthase
VDRGVRLTLAYDGTRFHGWQRQDGLRTVQGELQKSVERICRHPIQVFGAARTDAGVHAWGQVAAFATNRELSPRRWVQSINRYLPPDVSVRRAEPCAPGYNPRFDAHDKTYRYLFLTAPIRDALLHDRAWHLDRHIRYDFPDRETLADGRPRLDLAAMRAAAAALVGTHDFRAFRAAADTRDNTIRTMTRVEVIERADGRDDLLAVEVTGTAFMKNMVRIMAGTLIDVAAGRLTVDAVHALLGEHGDRRRGGVTAPPQGLTLVSISLGRASGDAPDAAQG